MSLFILVTPGELEQLTVNNNNAKAAAYLLEKETADLEDNCSTTSTLGDGPGPPDVSIGGSSGASNRLSPVIFTLQEPTDDQQLSSASTDEEVRAIMHNYPTPYTYVFWLSYPMPNHAMPNLSLAFWPKNNEFDIGLAT